MPFAESSPVRKHRKAQGNTIREQARLAGISESTFGAVERLRNPQYISAMLRAGLTPSKTTIEVTVRIAASLGLMKYNKSYTIEEVARLQRLIARRWITDRPARCKRPYPGPHSAHLQAA